MLESCDLDVTTADSGESAVELAEVQDFDIIFMDINMPGMDGYEACGNIRAKNKSVPVIALSADNISEGDSRFTESGMSGFLLKPLQIDELREFLSRYNSAVTADSGSDISDTVFDYSELITVMKDEKAVLRILKQFLSVHKRDCAMLEEDIRSRNFIGARGILHNIKGISGNMFCKKLYRISCTLSSELKQERSDSLDEFIEIWNLTVSTLKEYRDSLAEKYTVDEYKSDWNQVWKNFLVLSGEFDISAVDVFTENTQLFMDNMSTEEFRRLKKAVLNYDFLWISDNMQEEG
ncbi:MAG: response regulator [Ruminococcus flavefaciens]|nr:response regulator [Ruminococcus flavefaciens]MCM1229338.1 response regulator [Ruminococcus flavefaciens]